MANARRNDDFTLRIVVTDPEPETVDEDGRPTRPFKKALLGVVPLVPKLVRPKAEPLSHDDHHRVMRRVRAVKRIAWARAMLRKFNFVES
jgi:hypothetical protein